MDKNGDIMAFLWDLTKKHDNFMGFNHQIWSKTIEALGSNMFPGQVLRCYTQGVPWAI